MNEVTERFLRAIASRVPALTVTDVRLFPALRQGVWEAGVAVITVAPALETAMSERHTVHTARYRLAIKGPERGKWEFEMRAEADASLEAIDAVVAGVVERSDEPFEPERIPAGSFRTIVGAEDPTQPA